MMTTVQIILVLTEVHALICTKVTCVSVLTNGRYNFVCLTTIKDASITFACYNVSVVHKYSLLVLVYLIFINFLNLELGK